jgi:hypothetical protein
MTALQDEEERREKARKENEIARECDIFSLHDDSRRRNARNK